jgi:lysozyme
MNNQAITIAKDFIRSWEGLSLQSYKCSASVKTIGYGHVIKDTEDIGDKISKNQAESLLDRDLDKAHNVLFHYCRGLDLNHHQQAALISFIFNLGAGAFQSSSLRQKLNRGEYALASDEFLRWVHAGGKRVNGLVRRRQAERELFMRLVTEGTNLNQNFIETKTRNNIWSKLKQFFTKPNLV